MEYDIKSILNLWGMMHIMWKTGLMICIFILNLGKFSFIYHLTISCITLYWSSISYCTKMFTAIYTVHGIYS